MMPLMLGTTVPSLPERIALVVGNGAYPGNALPNPTNDARIVADLLTRAGFSVELRTDTPRAELLQAINRYGERMRAPRVNLAVFYYAGHGFQQDWRNYLVPVDAQVRSAADVAAQTVDVSELLRRMQGGDGRNHLVILDACRDDPFAGAYRPPMRGLSQFDAPARSLLAYATAPGQVAFDGPAGGNGLYTRHLVRELGAPESSVEDALKRVRLNVRVASRGRQVPWEMGSLEENVFLFPQSGRPAKPSEAELEARFERELAAWSEVRQSTSVDQLAQFIRSFPSGNTAELAQARLNRLLVEESRRAEPQRPAEQAPKPAEQTLAMLPAPAPALLAAWEKVPPLQLARVEPTPFFGGQNEHRRAYRVGDEFAHQVLERGRVTSTRSVRVTAVDAAADRVEFNGGEYLADMMGNIARNTRGGMSTPRQFYPAELVVGRRWHTEFKQARVSGMVYRFAYDVRVAARERITVPAGSFDAYRIEATGFNVGLGAFIKRTIWIAPGIDADLAHETYVRLRNGQVEQDDREELVSFKRGAGG